MTWSPKHPDSIEFFTADFTPALVDGETISALVSMLTISGGSDLVITNRVLAGNAVTATFSGGADGVTYRVETIATSSLGERLVIVSTLLVRARG